MSVNSSEDYAHEEIDPEEIDPEGDDHYYDVDPISLREELTEEARNPL